MSRCLINSINNRYTYRIEEIIKHSIDLDSKKRKIIDITEEYFVEVGEYMPQPLLYLLTEWFLADILKSKDVDKVSKTEYPVLSVHQIKRRGRKQIAVINDTLDHLNITRGRREKKSTREKEQK
jgi:hypothetical protein